MSIADRIQESETDSAPRYFSAAGEHRVCFEVRTESLIGKVGPLDRQVILGRSFSMSRRTRFARPWITRVSMIDFSDLSHTAKLELLAPGELAYSVRFNPSKSKLAFAVKQENNVFSIRVVDLRTRQVRDTETMELVGFLFAPFDWINDDELEVRLKSDLWDARSGSKQSSFCLSPDTRQKRFHKDYFMSPNSFSEALSRLSSELYCLSLRTGEMSQVPCSKLTLLKAWSPQRRYLVYSCINPGASPGPISELTHDVFLLIPGDAAPSQLKKEMRVLDILWIEDDVVLLHVSDNAGGEFLESIRVSRGSAARLSLQRLADQTEKTTLLQLRLGDFSCVFLMVGRSPKTVFHFKNGVCVSQVEFGLWVQRFLKHTEEFAFCEMIKLGEESFLIDLRERSQKSRLIYFDRSVTLSSLAEKPFSGTLVDAWINANSELSYLYRSGANSEARLYFVDQGRRWQVGGAQEEERKSRLNRLQAEILSDHGPIPYSVVYDRSETESGISRRSKVLLLWVYPVDKNSFSFSRRTKGIRVGIAEPFGVSPAWLAYEGYLAVERFHIPFDLGLDQRAISSFCLNQTAVLIQDVRKRFGVSDLKVVIGGFSFGATMAALMAAEYYRRADRDLPAIPGFQLEGLICISGNYDRKRTPNGFQYWDHHLWSFGNDRLPDSPFEHCPLIRCPVFLAHAIEDENPATPYSGVLTFYTGLRNFNPNIRLLAFSGDDHAPRRISTVSDIMKGLREFLNDIK